MKTVQPRAIEARGRPDRELLTGRKYSIGLDRREYCVGQRLRVGTLHEQAYDHNPSFIGANGLPFRAHAEFKKVDLDARQDLCRQLAERIWSPDLLAEEAAS